MARILILLLAFCLTACQQGEEQAAEPQAPGISAADIDGDYLTTGGDGTNWPAVNFSYAEQRHSPLTQINDDNVGKLGLAWFADLPDLRGQEATPIAVDGRIYVSTAWSKVLAFDARTGEELWSYDPEVPKSVAPRACCGVVNRGVAMWRGKLFVGTLDGRLIAIDANTGARLWETQTTPKDKPYTITSPPRVVKNLVIIGNGGADMGVRGFVSAYDVSDGSLVWRFYTTPNPQGKADDAASDPVWLDATKTWSAGGQWRETGGGGTVWDAISYDAELDQLYFGVGNGSPWNHGLRSDGKGDNLFLSSIVAVKAETGEYLWHYQEVPGESWDYTANQHILLADIDWPVASEAADEANTQAEVSERRKVILHAPKNGFFYVIDRRDGRLLSAEPFVKGINWAEGYDLETGRPIERPEARYYKTGKPFYGVPGGMGAHSWQPMSYHPETGLVYIPAQNAAQLYLPPASDADAKNQPLGMNSGLGVMVAGADTNPDAFKQAYGSSSGQLVAFDPRKGEIAWAVDYPSAWNGGTMTTAGNLVMQGTNMARFRANAADSGEQLLDLDVQSPVLGAPITYLVDGEQYVAFLTSKGGGFTLAASVLLGEARGLPNLPRLVVLKLNGKGKFPAVPERADIAWDPPEMTGTDARRAAGERLYARYCASCHGVAAIGAGVLPDLRITPLLEAPDQWRELLLMGTRRELGMPGYGDIFDAKDADAIRHYVIERSHWTRDNMAELVPPLAR